ncbi:MAG: hypothetical protein ACRCUS_02375 [Anaerovoracaceae bacterium]
MKHKEGKSKAKNEIRYISEIMATIGINQNLIQTRTGKYLDILKIVCRDIYSASEEELEYDNLCFDKLYKTFPGDLKEVAVNFLTDTSASQEYILDKIKKTKNPIFLAQLKQKKRELEEIAKTKTNREYYLFFYSKNIEEYRDNLIVINKALARGYYPLIQSISIEKKVEILKKLNNINSLV